MPQTNQRSRAIVVATWVAVLLASNLPLIIWREALDRNEEASWSSIFIIRFLGPSSALGLTFISPTVRPVRGFMLALIALVMGYLAADAIENSSTWVGWAETVPQHQLVFADTIIKLIPSLLMALTLIGSGLSRRNLFLTRGDLSAPSKMPWSIRPVPWTRLGPILVVAFAAPLIIALTFAVRPKFDSVTEALAALPIALTFAAINATSEEFRFRSVLLARIEPVVGAQQALLLTSTLFGLGHWFGHPSGPTGVLMTGIAGWFLGKSMLETQGFTWAWLMHAIQDVVIMMFLIMTASQ